MENITEYFHVIAAPNGLEDQYLISFCNGKLLNIKVEFGFKFVSIAVFNPMGLNAGDFRKHFNLEVA